MLRVGVAFPRHLVTLRRHCFGLVPTFWDSCLYTPSAIHLAKYFVAYFQVCPQGLVYEAELITTSGWDTTTLCRVILQNVVTMRLF
jgi:hypothetical protein